MGIDVRVADLRDAGDATDLVALVDDYARDPMGGGKPLRDEVKERLPGDLAARAGCVVLLARVVKELGADVHNLIPMTPVEGTLFEDIPEPDANTMLRARRGSSKYLKQMVHCKRCRADAVGLLGEDRSGEFAALMDEARDEVAANRPYVAVATQEGVLVNQHLGVASRLQIWERFEDGFRMVGDRPCPSPGSEGRWDELAQTVSDCRAVLVAAAGDAPRKALESVGVAVCEMEGIIDDALETVYGGGDVAKLRARRNGLGSACGCGKVREPGTGCG